MHQRWFGIFGFVFAVAAAAILVIPSEYWESHALDMSRENDAEKLKQSLQTKKQESANQQTGIRLTNYLEPGAFDDGRYPSKQLTQADPGILSGISNGDIQNRVPPQSGQFNGEIENRAYQNDTNQTKQNLKHAGLTIEDEQLLKNLPPSCVAGLSDYIQNPQPDVFANLPSTTDHVAPASLNRNVDQSHNQPHTNNDAGIGTHFVENQQHSTHSNMSNGGNRPLPIATNQDNNNQVRNSIRGGVDFASYNPHKNASASGNTVNPNMDCDVDPHLELYTKSRFPSAVECAQCHQQIFDEWAGSSHAYAAVSPMFHRFEDTINRLSQGTIGYFCMRCHAPIATTVGLRRDQAIWDGPRVFREGVTCIVCHRVKEQYTKSNGERRVEPGGLEEPIVASGDGKGVELAAYKYNAFYKTKTDPNDPGPGQLIHRRTIQFQQLNQSDYCMSCHQVAVQPGIKLEVVWDQYRASPAYKNGVTCQDCHMGKVPGVESGYSYGPAAVVSNRVVNPERKHANHVFYGPGYSIAHPGIFPQNPDADRWTFNQWLQFDWRAGWGTDEFEDKVADGLINAYFPPCWSELDDRYDAREVVNDNLKKLHYKKDLRRQVMENGSKIDGPFFAEAPQTGAPLKFHYCVTNTNPGHNMPSGSLGAQPQLWLNVVLTGPDGNRIWESGYLDSNGDLADLHSLDVLARRVPHDDQLFNLQTKFLTTNVKGTDREMYLPINFDIDQLPFLRPAPQPVSVLNHPPFIRMEGHSLPPLGSRKAKYLVPSGLMCEPGTYRLSVRLRSRAEPIYFMRFCNATPEMERMMNEWIVDAHAYSVVFEVK